MYNYEYKPDFAIYAGMSPDEVADTGVLAQEVQKVLPDAVKETGDIILPNNQTIDNFLVVNKVDFHHCYGTGVCNKCLIVTV